MENDLSSQILGGHNSPGNYENSSVSGDWVCRVVG